MATELLKKLQALDPDIAKVYVDLTKDDPKAVINADGVSQLFGRALDDKKLTPKELDALILIFERDTKLFAKDALDLAGAFFADRVLIESLARGGAATVLKSDKDLAEISAAMDLAGNSVDFFSPGTGLTYNVSAYQTLKQLILDKDILVIAVSDKGQVWDRGNAAAMYDPKGSTPVVFMFEKPADKRLRQATMAHEMTHAWQDWNDIQSTVKMVETDAVLVQSLVSVKLGLKAPPGHPMLPLIKLTKEGKQTDKKVWSAAYDAAATAVAQDPTYAQRIKVDPNADFKTGDEKKKQPEKVAAILKKLAAAKSTAPQGAAAKSGPAQGSDAKPAQSGTAQGSGARPSK